MNDSYSLSEAIQRLQRIVNQNPSEVSNILERLNNLSAMLQFPARVLSDGTSANAVSFKDSNINGDDNDDDNLSDKSKNNSLNTEYSRRSANELERKRVNSRLNGFSLKDSFAWQEICKRFGPNLNQSELLSLAEIIGQEAGIKVDREAKRRKEVLIKWYEENLEVVLKMLPYVKLVDSDGNALKGDQEDDENDANSDENNEANKNSNENIGEINGANNNENNVTIADTNANG